MTPSTIRLAIALLAALGATAAVAEHSKRVGDSIVHIGVVPARDLAADPGERAQHGDALRYGGQHVVVSLADATTGQPAIDAEVWLRVQDPKGRVEERRLVPGTANGTPDYSGVFAFGWSGSYRLQVRTAPTSAKPALLADFAWTHVVR